MKLLNNALVRVPLAVVAALSGWLAAYSAMTLDRNYLACTTSPDNYELDTNWCIRSFNTQVDTAWVAGGVALLALLGIYFAPSGAAFLRRHLLNRTAALIVATGAFLLGAIANAGEAHHSMLVLTFGLLAAISFAGVVFGSRSSSTP